MNEFGSQQWDTPAALEKAKHYIGELPDAELVTLYHQAGEAEMNLGQLGDHYAKAGAAISRENWRKIIADEALKRKIDIETMVADKYN